MATVIVILLIGLPGSGKSTVARAICAAREDSVHIEYDKIAASVDEEDRLESWRRSRVAAIDELLDLFRKPLPPSLIVMDDNFHLRSMRKTIYRICQEEARKDKVVSFGIVFVDTPITICLARNETRLGDARVLDEVIEKMATTLESPDANKAAWEASAVSVDGSATEFETESIVEWMDLLEPVELPPPGMSPEEIEIERQATFASRMHGLDQLTRKWVTEVAKVDKQYAGTANSCRKHLLQRHRSNESVSPADLVPIFCETVCIGWDAGQRESLQKTLSESVKGLAWDRSFVK